MLHIKQDIDSVTATDIFAPQSEMQGRYLGDSKEWEINKPNEYFGNDSEGTDD